MTSRSIQQFKDKAKESLSGLYPQTEINQLTQLVLQHVLQLSSTQLLIHDDIKFSAAQQEDMNRILERLAHAEPIQYVLKSTEFYDLHLELTSDVLIPRPETEELVHWILNDNKTNKSKLLDIGTGSGCIALALKSKLAASQVEAWDISNKALSVAQKNAAQLNLDVTFKEIDILNYDDLKHSFTCIVSNPPYVRNLEKEMMQANVLKFEPHLALFVEDDDPLLFYRVIAQKGLQLLMDNGCLYFEINEYLETEMTQLLTNLGYINIECRKDMQGKARMIKAIRP